MSPKNAAPAPPKPVAASRGRAGRRAPGGSHERRHLRRRHEADPGEGAHLGQRHRDHRPFPQRSHRRADQSHLRGRDRSRVQHLIMMQGHGKMGVWDIETPALIRYGQLTNDEFFVSEKAALEGVTITNNSTTDPIVMLKHFGPENPDLVM